MNSALDDIIIDDIKIKEKNTVADEVKKWIKKSGR
jgi:hypothetical protein